VIAVATCWLGGQWVIIRERIAFLQNVKYAGPANHLRSVRPHSAVPLYRLWMGDRSIEEILAFSEAGAATADRLFPELKALYFRDVDGFETNFDGERRVARPLELHYRTYVK
jgi:hypothetical protein